MWVFTDIADWFDGKNKQTDQILDKWVEDSGYSQGVMIVAATTHAFTTFGAGFADLLRTGDGLKEGTWKGLGQDTMRFVAIFPTGKVAQMLRTLKGITFAKAVADINPNAGICAWITSTKALRQIGHEFQGRILATVEDLAKAVGIPFSSIGSIPGLQAVLMMLRQVGAKTGPIIKVSNFEQVVQMLPKDGSIVLLSLRGFYGRQYITSHLVYIYRQSNKIYIMDRSTGGIISAGTAQGAFRSMLELIMHYSHSINKFELIEAAVLHNVFVRSVAYELPKLVIPILGVIGDYQDNKQN